MARALVAAGLLAAALSGCAATDDPAAGKPLTLVLLKTGPRSGALSQEETKELFAGHFANMGRLAEERQLLLAGPFGKPRHDESLRGLFILDTGDPARARELAETDPTAKAGVFTLEYHALSTDAPLHALLERVLAAEAEAKAAGTERSPGEGVRNYVLLTAEDGARAEPLLAPLLGSGNGRVLLLGRLDGTKAFAILDATDPDLARAALGDVTTFIGPHVLDGWYATSELTALPTLADRD